MKKSDFLATQFVGFCPLVIRNSGEYLLAILDCTGNITLAGKHGHPCFLVAILKFACVHHEPGKIIPGVDTHGLATFNKAVVKSRYLCTRLGYVEQPVAAPDTEWSDCILGSLIAACSERIIEEPLQCLPPLQRIVERWGCGLGQNFIDVLLAELVDFIEKQFKNQSSFSHIILRSSEFTVVEPVLQKSFIVEERRVDLEQFESLAGLRVMAPVLLYRGHAFNWRWPD